MHFGLGLMPSWQYSEDPTVNPKINPHVIYPDGMYQTTPQPAYPYYQGPELSGLGAPIQWELIAAHAQRLAQNELDRRKKAAYSGENDHLDGSFAGPRMVLRGPNMLLGAPQLLGFGMRAALGLSLGLGAVALLGKFFSR